MTTSPTRSNLVVLDGVEPSHRAYETQVGTVRNTVELATGLAPAYYGFAIRTLTIRGTPTMLWWVS